MIHHRPTPDAPAVADGPTLRVLGRLELVAPGGSVLLGPGKPLALLAYLRSQAVRGATRPHLVDLLWSDLEPERARANLRQALLVLRRVLPAGTLVSDGDQVLLAGALPSDRDEFVAAVDRGDLATALAVYRGDFIPDVAMPGGAEFEVWCEVERRHLATLFVRVLETLARDALAAGRGAEALQLARRLRDLDPSRERTWRLLIEAEIAAEGLASARLEAERLVEMLRTEGRPAEPATTQLLQRVRDVARPTPMAAGAMGTPEFVGREAQLARVLAVWTSVKRGRRCHLHVEALAGTGKTRLLEESCARLQATGARVVRCGARRDERDVPYALAASLVTALAALPGAISVAPSSMAALVAMAPDASAMFSAHADAATGEEAARRRAVALADLLGAVTHESALVVAVDDLHWADQASLHVMGLAKGRLAGDARLLLLSAGRDPLPADGDVERVALPPLTSPQVDAMLASLAGAGDRVWWETFVDALRSASDGVPFHVLQIVHAVVEKHLLLIADDVWAAPDVPALLRALDAREAARLRLAQLSAGEQAILRLLSCGLPVSDAVLSTASGAPLSDVTSALTRLEVRGYARRPVHGAWMAAHDEISELVRAQTEAGELRTVRRALARAVADEDAVSVSTLRQVVALLMQAEADTEVGDIVRTWVRTGAYPRSGVHVADLMPPGLDERRTATLRRTLRRALPTPTSRSRQAWQLGGAVALILAILGFWLTRPARLYVAQDLILSNAWEILDRPIVIGVQDRLGRKLRLSGPTVRVRADGALGPFGRTEAKLVGGLATFDSLVVGASGDVTNRLVFEVPGLAPVRWERNTAVDPQLAIRSGVLNGTRLDGALPSITVAPGDSIVGRVTLRYRNNWTSATVVFGGLATWYPRETDTATVRSLVTPIDTGYAEAPVRRTAPRTPGRYFLIWAMGAEPRAAFLFSSTNWTCTRPLWHDGNDLQDAAPDLLRAAATRGTLVTQAVRCIEYRAPAPPHPAPSPIGIAAVEVVVR